MQKTGEKKPWQIMFYLFLLFFLANCATSPGRHMVAAGEFSLGVSLSGTITDQVESIKGIPLPLNLGITLAYGFTDELNGQIILYPVPLATKSLVIDPVIVFHITDETELIPTVNGYFALPMEIHFTSRQFNLYPTLGVTVKYNQQQYIPYLSTDINLSLGELLEGVFTGGFAFRLGEEFALSDNNTLALEIGLQDIGKKSIVNTMSRSGWGVFLFGIESTWDFGGNP